MQHRQSVVPILAYWDPFYAPLPFQIGTLFSFYQTNGGFPYVFLHSIYVCIRIE